MESKAHLVDDPDSCKLAMAEIWNVNLATRVLKHENNPNWPKGCYSAGSKVYFNEHLTGSSHKGARHICKKGISILCNSFSKQMNNKKTPTR